ncbi:MAG: helix-turn-helix domain-containing protein [Saprospiraceae bacterium]|nr:helix-turn-helix domain-containing protein [Saprospiraceae bacterium]
MKQRELGIKLAELRKAKGLTQEDIVAKCNINIRTLQRIEAGEVVPRSYTLQAILSVLEVDFTGFTNQLNANTEIKEDLDHSKNRKQTSMIGFIESWSFALYIALLIVFSLLIKFGMPWYYYILPVAVTYLINTKDLEIETN